MKIELDEVIDALEFVNGGIDSSAFFNPDTYEIIYVSDMMNKEREELDEKYISLPTKFNIDEYSMMEEFIETIENNKIYNHLYDSITGSKAFRRFKDTCINYGIIDDWYKFRD